jgi:hypothetical protein
VDGVRLAVVIPVYNDWDAFLALAPTLDEAFAAVALHAAIVTVDDGSTKQVPVDAKERLRGLRAIDAVEVLHLVANVGHQRAIAIGLATVVARDAYSHMLVMDADGEDRPPDAVRLVECAAAESSDGAAAFVAQRGRRSEGAAFQAGYVLYKMLFRFLSGQVIDFGNFSLLTAPAARRLVHMAETWNHFAAALLKARIPLRRIPTSRGHRLAGRSSMNVVSLVTLGLSAISVYSEAVFVRLLLGSLALSATALIGLIAVVVIRVFTALAIPGWATTAGGFFGIILVQAVTLSAIATFLALSARSAVTVGPAIDAAKYVERTEVLAGPGSAG